MDKETLYQSLEFKLSKKILMREFPYIKDVIITDRTIEEFDKYSLIWLTMVVDGDKFCEMYNAEIRPYSQYQIRIKGYDDCPALIYGFQIKDVTDDKNSEILNGIKLDHKNAIRSKNVTNWIPVEKRLNCNKIFHPQDYLIV